MTHPLKTLKNTAQMPARLNHLTIAEFCNQLKNIAATKNGAKHLFIDAQNAKFIDALAMTVLLNHIADIKMQGWQTYISNHLNDKGKLKDPIQFMDDAEFFLRTSGKRLSAHTHSRANSLPIQWLNPDETVAWLRFNAIRWMAKILEVAEQNLIEIQVCIEELFNNIHDHSGVNLACIFIQYYPHKGELKICLSDNGVGLVHKIQQARPEFDEQEAIAHALKEGFSTRSSPRNAGMGLFTLTQTVCNNGGQFAIRTGKIHALISPENHNEPRILISNNIEHLQGTAFEITLYSSGIDHNQSDMEDFSWE